MVDENFYQIKVWRPGGQAIQPSSRLSSQDTVKAKKRRAKSAKPKKYKAVRDQSYDNYNVNDSYLKIDEQPLQ